MQSWRRRWRASEKSESCCLTPPRGRALTVLSRSAKKAADEALAKKTAGGSTAKIIVPGTPRHTGIGAGARISQTPRRRGGI